MQGVAVGHQREGGEQGAANEMHQVRQGFAAVAVYALRFRGLERPPKLCRRGGQRWFGDGVAQLAEVREGQLQRAGAGVDGLDGGDFVLVFLQPGLEVRHFGAGLLHGGGVEAGVAHFVDGVAVHRLLARALHLQDALAQGGVEKRRRGVAGKLVGGGFELLRRGLRGVELCLGGGGLCVRVAGLQQAVGEIL